MNLKNLAMWAIIVFLTIGLYNMFKNPQANIRSSNEVIFSEFLESVEPVSYTHLTLPTRLLV